MKTLPLSSLLVISVLAVTSAVAAGPRSKNISRQVNTEPAYSAPGSTAEKTMVVKNGKRTTTVVCDGASPKCKAHCGK
jgi:hypothetical protein